MPLIRDGRHVQSTGGDRARVGLVVEKKLLLPGSRIDQRRRGSGSSTLSGLFPITGKGDARYDCSNDYHDKELDKAEAPVGSNSSISTQLITSPRD